VLASSFAGLYLDANALSPKRTIQMGQDMEAAGVAFVDGGIIGEPAWKPHSTWLYLAGPHAADVAACFSAGPLETHVLGETIGKASALKMCFAAYGKGTIALLSAVLATAEQLGVREALCRQWARKDPDFPAQVSLRVRDATAKAWRFAGEMEEIASTFHDAGMPGDFHAAAACIYRRLARFKDFQTPPEIEDVLTALLQGEKEP
jgi:3-hydroxyisobutyrate dehydrogenase-like beta-hydroxyacid dehydrogenase